MKKGLLVITCILILSILIGVFAPAAMADPVRKNVFVQGYIQPVQVGDAHYDAWIADTSINMLVGPKARVNAGVVTLGLWQIELVNPYYGLQTGKGSPHVLFFDASTGKFLARGLAIVGAAG